LPLPVPRSLPAVAAGGIQWPSFTGQATLVGTSADGGTTVYYDSSLGAAGLANAQALVSDAARINALDDGFFGVKGGPTNVIIFALGGATDGTGGADHASCSFSTGANIEVCAAFGKDARCSALYEAERSECQMRNNLCGLSTGEALSRLCAEYGIFPSGPNPLADFASTPSWVQAGYPNWVDKTQPSDGDYPSIGAGMAFLSWLRAQKFTIAQIAQAMVSLGDSGTLSQLYSKLTGHVGSPWSTFLAAAKALPAIKDDDPFAGATPLPGGNTGTLTVGTALPAGTLPVNGNAAALSIPQGLATGTYPVGGTATPPPGGPTLAAAQKAAAGAVDAYAAHYPRYFRPYITNCEPGVKAALAQLWSSPQTSFSLSPPAALALPGWASYLEQILLKYGEQALEQILQDILAGKVPKP
jgi:hypothetical protein